ncbi:MAG TPA: HypC/HybG/HupF family hydrogenase formation chaperone [Actinotalea sp.]|nr:HypC/HybG/HupF family hydrogenase formation chaperone [Actinotalea sp.]
MCLGIPARILEVVPGPLPMASADLAGTVVECCVVYLPDARVGDHVLIQNGFAVELLDDDSAAQSLAAFAELGLIPPTPPATPAGP